MTACEADSGLLMAVPHDRDHTLAARDLKKIFLVSYWFIFGLNLGFCLAFWGIIIFGIRAGIRSKLGF